MIELARAIDNPVVLRAVFGRIRFPGAWLWVGIIAVVCLFIVAGGIVLAPYGSGRFTLPQVMTTSFGIIFGFQCLLLHLVGTSSVATAVAADRERAVFDMMRMVPRPAWHIVGGYVLGMPLREHLWTLVAMPFAWLAILLSRISILDAAALYLHFYVLALLYHSLGALIGIVAKRSRNAAGHAVGILILYHIIGWAILPGLSIYRTVGWAFHVRDASGLAQYFTLQVPIWLHDVAFAGMMAIFIGVAALRKFRTEDRPALSKLQALAFAALFLAMVLGGIYPDITGRGTGGWFRGMGVGAEVGLGLYSCAAFIMAGTLVFIVTPTATLVRRSVRRAVKAGRPGISPLQDAGLNLVAALALVLLFAVSLLPLLAHLSISADGLAALVLTFGAGLLLLAGLLQWCTLRLERSWPAVFAGLLVLFWGLPSGLALLAGISGVPRAATAGLGSLFPILGMAFAVSDDGVAGSLIAGVLGLGLAVLFIMLARRAMGSYWKAAREAA